MPLLKTRIGIIKEETYSPKIKLGTISKKTKVFEAGKGYVTGVAGQNYLAQMMGKRKPGRPKGEYVEPRKPFKKYISAYAGVPMVAAAIDRTVDFVVSPGYYVVTESKQAKKKIDQFIDDMDFDVFLRNVVKDMLIFGDSFVEIVGKRQIKELKVLNPVNMRVKRTSTGDVTGYIQTILGGTTVGPKWSSDEIAHFIYNKIGDAAYGTSIIESLLTILRIKVNMENSMEKIMKRKAGAPYHVKMGSDEFPATQDDIDSFASDLQHLTENTEWVTSHVVDIEAVGVRSKIIDIEPFTQHIDNQMVYGLQVPYVLLGLGRIPEGLARVQLEAMDRRAKSIQLLVEQQLENKIFSKLTNQKVEFQWGSPSQEMFTIEMGEYLSMLKSPISDKTKVELENKIRQLLGFEGKISEEDIIGRKEDRGIGKVPRSPVGGGKADLPGKEKTAKDSIRVPRKGTRTR